MTEKRPIHLVPQFHYDIEYLLPSEPYLEVSFENLLEAHRLLAKHPEYTYLVEQTSLLEQFLCEYPSLADDFRKWAEAGRLEVASGIYAMADINMSSGESIIRQCVVGKQWCAKHLGCEPRVLNMGDCTGHPAQMPQLARHCGYGFFVFVRAVDDPSRKSEILWLGIDGSEIRTYWLAAGYAGWKPPSSEAGPPTLNTPVPLETATAKVLDHGLSRSALLPHGGDFVYPYEKGPLALAEWNRAHPDCPIHYSTYTRALESMEWDKAPTYKGDWNPDRTGCYSSRIRIKQNNRECEALLMTAEAVSAFAELRMDMPPDHDGLLRAWKLTFLNQFHDTLWGTILDEAYQNALNRAGRVRMITRNIIEHRLQAILDAQGEKPDGRRVMVFNPLPWARTVDVPLSGAENVNLPPCGYRLLDITTAAPDRNSVQDTPFSCSTESYPAGGESVLIETPLYKATVSPSGIISSLVRRSDDLEFVDCRRPWFNALCCQTDQGDLWQYYEGPTYDGGERRFEQDLIHDPYPLTPQFSKNGRRIIGFALDNRLTPATEISIHEKTAHRLVVRIQGELCRYWPHFREYKQYGVRIFYDQTITFRADTPRIDFHLRTRHEKGRYYRLRAAFFTDIQNGAIIHEIPCGRFVRPEGEFAAQNYMAYGDNRKGLALFNRGLPGNNVTDGVMMLSLMRSVSFEARADSSQAFEEGEEHIFDYAILPFGGEKELDTTAFAREGAEFVTPPYVFQKDPARLPISNQNTMPAEDELLNIEPQAICCTAVYPHENAIVIRLFESEGKETESLLRVNFAVECAEETDALLRRRSPLDHTQNEVRLNFKPFEIKTILIEKINCDRKCADDV